jgi:ribonuclease Z
MHRVILIAVAIVVVLVILLGGLYQVVTNTIAGQDFLLKQAARRMIAPPEARLDGISVFMCGTAAPLPAPGRAQACVAVLTREHYFVVDAGSGSANNLGLEGLPAAKLDGVLLTHYHSDHIADVPAMNVVAWASGHEGPLKVYGPPGIQEVVDGFNLALTHDRVYRTEHHGADLLPPAYGVMEAVESPVEARLEFGDLTITSFAADHSPVEPAVSYRFDYKGRSVVITGDTVVTTRLEEMTTGADLLLSDALSVPIVQTMEAGTRAAGNARLTKILVDIQDYHARADNVIALTQRAGIGMTGFYHLVPGPRNKVMENIFKRGFTDNMVLTHDRMWFELPAGSDAIDVID